MCVRKVMPHTRLWLHCQNAGGDWIFDQHVARCSKFGVCEKWCTTPFVGCEARRPMLSMAMLGDKGFDLTVGDGCRKLGGHGREMILRRKGNSNLVDVEFQDGIIPATHFFTRTRPAESL